MPKILHSGNGHEFVNEVVESVVREYPAEVIIHIVAITYNTSGTIWSGQIELFVASPVPCALVRRTHAADVKVDEQLANWIQLAHCQLAELLGQYSIPVEL